MKGGNKMLEAILTTAVYILLPVSMWFLVYVLSE